MAEKPDIDGEALLKIDGKPGYKAKLSGGKTKFPKITAPARLELNISGFAVDKKQGDMVRGIKPDRFEIHWVIDLAEDGKLSVLGKPQTSTQEMPASSIKLDLFDRAKSVGVNFEMVHDPPLLGKTIYRETIEFEFDVEVPNAKERLAKIKAQVVCVGCEIGAFPVGVAETKKVKKHKSAYDWSALRAWYDKLPTRTQEMITNDLKPGGKKVEIVGHADNQGGRAENDKLGLKRAENVRDWIIAWSGCTSKALFACKTKGEGPKGNDKKEQDNPDRRRVTVLIMAEK